MSSCLTHSQHKTLLGLFNSLTKANGAGPNNSTLSVQQLTQILRIFNQSITEVEVQDLLAEIDVGESSSEQRCDYNEFLHLFTRSFHSASSSDGVDASTSSLAMLNAQELLELKTLFEKYDVDCDGKLSKTEFNNMMKDGDELFQPQELLDLMRELDNTNKEHISLHDFLVALSPQ